MAKICRVIQIKLNQLCPHASLTYQQSAFKRYHSDKHFSDGGKNQPTDMEQNYVTVTLCTVPSTSSDGQALIICNSINQSISQNLQPRLVAKSIRWMADIKDRRHLHSSASTTYSGP